MKYLFAYGTLQFPSIQKEVLGRELKRVFPDTVNTAQGFKLEQLTIENIPYTCAVVTGEMEDKVLGTVWEIEESDIPKLDEFETRSYSRFDLLSITDCMIYVKS